MSVCHIKSRQARIQESLTGGKAPNIQNFPKIKNVPPPMCFSEIRISGGHGLPGPPVYGPESRFRQEARMKSVI